MTGSELFRFLDLVKEFEQEAKKLKDEDKQGSVPKAHAYEDAAKRIDKLLHELNP